MSDQQREQLKQPPQGPDGWTADEILAWEQYRHQMMLKPVIMVSKELESGLRKEYEKTHGHIVGLSPGLSQILRKKIDDPCCPSSKILATP
jgi:hypothetical protein